MPTIPASIRSTAALVFLLACTTVGCAAPHVELKNATARGVEFDGVRFDAMLAVSNSNSFDVQIRAIRANVRMENIGQPIPIIIQPNMWVRAGSTVYLPVPVKVPWGMVPAVLSKTITKNTVSFRVMGNADVTATSSLQYRLDGYRFNEEGELPRGVFLQIGGGGPPVTFGVGRRW